MTLQVIKGDLFDPAHRFDAIAQGVNCRGIMGAGIAVKFRELYPEMYESYQQECEKYGPILPGLLHSYFEILAESDMQIYNLFTQYQPGPNATYELLDRSTYLLLKQAESDYSLLQAVTGKARIGMPWIGCGIGGLQQHNVLYILGKYLTDSEVDFFIVEQE